CLGSCQHRARLVKTGSPAIIPEGRKGFLSVTNTLQDMADRLVHRPARNLPGPTNEASPVRPIPIRFPRPLVVPSDPGPPARARRRCRGLRPEAGSLVVLGPPGREPARRGVVPRRAAVPPGLLGDRLAGTTDRRDGRLPPHGQRHVPPGRTTLHSRHPPV